MVSVLVGRWVRALRLFVITTVALLAGCGAGTSSAPPLSTLLIKHVDDFVTSPRSEAPYDALKAGPVGIAGAASTCDGVSRTSLRQDHWRASYLRAFANMTKNPGAFINVCVNEMDNPTDAAENYREVRGASSISGFQHVKVAKIQISGVPGVRAFSISLVHLDFVEFCKGDYVVTIVAEDLPTGATGLHATLSHVSLPLVTVTTQEYRLLPG